MAVTGRCPTEDETMKENRSDNYFGLIAEAGASVAYLHGYEVTMDGSVVVPELCPNPSNRRANRRAAATPERGNAVKASNFGAVTSLS